MVRLPTRPEFGQVMDAIKDRAILRFAAVTMREHPDQNALKAPQLFNFLSHVSDVLFGDLFDLRAHHVPSAREAKKRANLVERETQLSRTSNKD